MLNPRRVVIVFLASSLLVAGEADDKVSSERREAAGTRSWHIRADVLKGDSPAWAGEYCAGQFPGDHCHPPNLRLLLSPESGFVFEAYYEARDARSGRYRAALFDLKYGTVGTGAESLALTSDLPDNPMRYIDEDLSRLIPVTWGARHYLIPVPKMAEFLNDVNAGWHPFFDQRFLLRRGDESRPRLGLPDLPARYKNWLLTSPITTTIAEVGGRTSYPGFSNATKVTLATGTQDGVWNGMRFYGTSPQGIEISAVVIDAALRSCEAVLGSVPPQNIAAGWKLSSTRPPKRTSVRGTRMPPK